MTATPSPELVLLVALLVVASTLIGAAVYESRSTSIVHEPPHGSPGFVAVADVAQSPCPPCPEAPLYLIGQAQVTNGTPPYADTWIPGNGQADESGAEVRFNLSLSGYYFTILESRDSTGALATGVWEQYINLLGIPPATNWVLGRSTTPVGEAPLTVTFFDTYNFTWNEPPPTPTAVDWVFGDGQRASGNPITHTFSQPGEYLTLLTATFAQGSNATFAFTVDVLGPDSPVLTFANNTPGGSCSGPVIIPFHANVYGGSAPYSYDWSFGDGSPDSAIANPTHSYSQDFYGPGTTVQLTVTDSRGVTGTDRFPVQFVFFPCPLILAFPWVPLGLIGGVVAVGVAIPVSLSATRSVRTRNPPPGCM